MPSIGSQLGVAQSWHPLEKHQQQYLPRQLCSSMQQNSLGNQHLPCINRTTIPMQVGDPLLQQVSNIEHSRLVLEHIISATITTPLCNVGNPLDKLATAHLYSP